MLLNLPAEQHIKEPDRPTNHCQNRFFLFCFNFCGCYLRSVLSQSEVIENNKFDRSDPHSVLFYFTQPQRLKQGEAKIYEKYG